MVRLNAEKILELQLARSLGLDLYEECFFLCMVVRCKED